MPRPIPESNYYSAKDVMAMMEVKERKAYEIIKELNDELEAMGKYIPRRGRILKSYFHYRTDINASDFPSLPKPAKVDSINHKPKLADRVIL